MNRTDTPLPATTGLPWSQRRVATWGIDPTIYVFTGPRGAGKTHLLQSVAYGMRAAVGWRGYVREVGLCEVWEYSPTVQDLVLLVEANDREGLRDRLREWSKAGWRVVLMQVEPPQSERLLRPTTDLEVR